MIAKELEGIWWKLLLAAVGAVPAGLIVAAYLPPYETTNRVVERFHDEAALGQILNVYEGGGIALALLAILLGAATVSEETSRGTIFLLLSKPTSRARILLTKYAISAGVLLAAAVFGHIMLIVAAVARGYPTGLLSASGMLLSTALIWLGSLSVLSLASLTSVLLRSLIGAGLTVVLPLCLIFNLSGILDVLLYNLQDALKMQDSQGVPTYLPYGPPDNLNLVNYWTDASLYLGEGFAATNFLICLIAATAPLLVALRVFGRKAY